MTSLSVQYLLQFGGFSAASGEEECFADLHYAHSDPSKLSLL